MNLLVYREQKTRWVSGGNDRDCVIYDSVEERYLDEVENILLTDREVLDYLDDGRIAIINIIKLNQDQVEAFERRP